VAAVFFHSDNNNSDVTDGDGDSGDANDGNL
jgi:hypothetical protein